jgi:hypothetical protein
MKNMESGVEINEQPHPATIRIEIFRHDEKAENTNAVEQTPGEDIDKPVRLSKAGRLHATEVGKKKSLHPEVGIVYGSSRDRTTETALRQLLSNEETIGDASLEQIKELIGGHVKVGKKDKTTELLDFNFDGSVKFKDSTREHFLNKKDLLVWYLEESDNLIRTEKDNISTSYSRLAGNVAELVLRYVDMYPNWQRVASEHPEKYSKFNNELQRLFGTHQGVSEAFLMKILEKTKGRDDVYKFIDSLKSKNGFSYSEGSSIIIAGSDVDSRKQITIKIGDEEIAIDDELVRQIMSDRDELNMEIKKSKEKNE